MPQQTWSHSGLAALTAFLLTALLLALPPASLAQEGHRPAPLMDFVPQEAGMYDASYVSLTEQDCRACHGQSTVDRHHFSPAGLTGSCSTCHEVGPPPDYGVIIVHNCLSCHDPAAGSPHHTGAQAQAMECTDCHNPRLVGAFWGGSDPSQDPPQVSPPTPYSCDNCHWAQPLTDTLPSTDQHYGSGGTLLANQYFSVPGFSVQPLELPDNPGDNGWLYQNPLMSTQNTHHVGGLYHDCTDCHAYADGYPGPDPSDPVLIRYCERCHTQESLHAIPGHVEAYEGAAGLGNAYNAAAWEAAEVSGTGDATVYRVFSREERCTGCHGQVPTTAAPTADLPPYVHSVSPAGTELGGFVTISGTGFGDAFSPGCAVQVRAEGASEQWQVMPPVAWTSSQISFLVPAWSLSVGNYYVRVLTPAGPSNERVFSSTGSCCLSLGDVADSMDPSGFDGDLTCYGPIYSKVKVFDSGFIGSSARGPLSVAATSAGVNYFTQILLEPAGGGRTLIVADPALRDGTPNPKASISGWVPAVNWLGTKLTFKLSAFWEDTNGNWRCEGPPGAGENLAVPVTTIAPGSYSVRLRRVYWKDWDGSGSFNQPDPADPSDPANEALLVTLSDPVRLVITTDPAIKKVKPYPVPANTKAVLVGINFGATQLDSTVNVYAKDGVSLVRRLSADSAKMRLWTATKIKFIMADKPGKVRWVSVTVKGKESNKVKVKVGEPPA